VRGAALRPPPSFLLCSPGETPVLALVLSASASASDIRVPRFLQVRGVNAKGATEQRQLANVNGSSTAILRLQSADTAYACRCATADRWYTAAAAAAAANANRSSSRWPERCALLAILRNIENMSVLRPAFISANQIRWPPNFGNGLPLPHLGGGGVPEGSPRAQGHLHRLFTSQEEEQMEVMKDPSKQQASGSFRHVPSRTSEAIAVRSSLSIASGFNITTLAPKNSPRQSFLPSGLRPEVILVS
jgi:hypothetical protein